jgi:hypothetical protein
MRALMVALSVMGLWAGEREEVAGVVQKTFDAMAAHDAAGIQACFVAGARLTAIRETGEVTHQTVEQFAERMGQMKAAVRERMWDVEVKVEGKLASLWAPYDFERDGKRTHCGIDQANLVKTEGGWKIVSLTFTMETKGCGAGRVK